MQRVLFIHHRPQPSGAAKSLALLISALGDDWEAHVLVPGGAAAELFRTAGATVHAAPVPAFTHTWDVQYHGLRWLVAFREAADGPAHVHTLRRLLRELRPAIVHLNDSVLLLSAAVVRRAGVPIVWHLRSSLPVGPPNRRSRWIAGNVRAWSAATIAIDQDVAASFGVPAHVIPNPVTTRAGEPFPLPGSPEEARIGYVGYLRRQKGWPEFLEALRLLLDAGIPVRGVVVGGAIRPATAFAGWRGMILRAVGIPNEEAAFADLISSLHLTDQVTIVPFLDDIGPVYRALDLIVFPNRGLGLGRPVLEAAAYGVPAVASGSTSGGGVLVPDETGLLVTAPGTQPLADAIGRLVTDPELRSRLGAAAKRGSAAWRPETIGEMVEEVYERVAGPG